jgi:hypothetical protein
MSTLRDRILAHPAVESISDEREPGDRTSNCEGDGIWVYLKDGWANFENGDGYDALHCVHEWTWTKAYSVLTRHVHRETADNKRIES